MEEFEITIKLKVKTNKSFEEVERAIKRGLYRGFDTEPNYIAQPKYVDIVSIKQETKTN